MTFIRCSTGEDADRAVVTDHGIHRLGTGQFMRWKDTEALSGEWWIDKASAETCPEWTP